MLAGVVPGRLQLIDANDSSTHQVVRIGPVITHYSEVQRVTRDKTQRIVAWAIVLGLAAALSVAVVAQAGSAGAVARSAIFYEHSVG